jgi:hypothetical protein
LSFLFFVFTEARLVCANTVLFLELSVVVCLLHLLYRALFCIYRVLLRQILEAMSLKHNDLISLPEFLAAFSHVPFHGISDQMDVIGSCSAQFAALLYETMGIIKPQLVGERVVLPGSFSQPSTSTRNRLTTSGQILLKEGASFGEHQKVVLTL